MSCVLELALGFRVAIFNVSSDIILIHIYYRTLQQSILPYLPSSFCALVVIYFVSKPHIIWLLFLLKQSIILQCDLKDENISQYLPIQLLLLFFIPLNKSSFPSGIILFYLKNIFSIFILSCIYAGDNFPQLSCECWKFLISH